MWEKQIEFKKQKLVDSLNKCNLVLNMLNNIEEEIGDLLITIVNLARFFDISADLALKKTNKKFYRRFNIIEKIVKKNNQKIEEISLAELLNYWKEAKNEEK